MADFDTSYEYDGSYNELPAINEDEEEDEEEYDEEDARDGDGYGSMSRFTGGPQIDPALTGEDRKYGVPMDRTGEGSSGRSVDAGRDRLREGTFDDATSMAESEGWEREGSSKPSKRMKVENKTCDNCRKRKIKCKEEEGDADPLDKACEGCRKLGIECTFEYIRKRPGRKNGFLARLEAERVAAVTGNSVEHELKKAAQPSKPRKPSQKALSAPSLPLPLGFDTVKRQPSRHVAQPPQPSSSFAFSPRNRGSDLDLSWLDAMIEGTAAGSFPVQDTPTADWSFNDQAQLLALESPENASQSGSANGTVPPSVIGGFGGTPTQMTFMQASKVVAKREPQLEDVTTWANISHFISLFLQYLYPLLPLVHRPTFAEHLATRRDLRDSDFRALLLSIVAYVISQLPTSRLVNENFDVDGLKRLQRRCHRTCKSLQRTYYGPTNLTQIATIIFDMFYLLSIGLGHTAASRLGQAVQLAYSMGLHSDERTMSQGLDCIEIQLRRRVFWQLYASDKTRAIPGAPMLINDFQGVCSYPAEIDDDFITAQGGFPQPATRISVLCGFVTVSKVFRFLSECFFHHRCVTTGMKTIPTRWTEKAEERLNRLVGPEMPEALHHPESAAMGSGASSEVLGMQRANILITAAIAKFALYDLRAALNEVKADQLAVEREKIAKEVHECLMTIPMEELASNGESVRGKVFHIACALCVQGPMDGAGQEVFKSFCEMFSAITFVQMPVPPPGDVADSSANSPVPH